MNIGIRTTFVCLLVLIGAWNAVAQTAPKVIRLGATEEYQTEGNGSSEAGRHLAEAVATRNILKDAATELRNFDEVKVIPLKVGQFDALLPAILEVKQEAVQSSKVRVTLRIDPSDV